MSQVEKTNNRIKEGIENIEQQFLKLPPFNNETKFSVFLGRTGAGKSTIVNALTKCHMIAKRNEYGQLIISTKGKVNTLIQHENYESGTQIPVITHLINNNQVARVCIDCPGDGDTNPENAIVNCALVKYIMKRFSEDNRCCGLKIFYVIDYVNMTSSSRGSNLKEMLNLLKEQLDISKVGLLFNKCHSGLDINMLKKQFKKFKEANNIDYINDEQLCFLKTPTEETDDLKLSQELGLHSINVCLNKLPTSRSIYIQKLDQVSSALLDSMLDTLILEIKNKMLMEEYFPLEPIVYDDDIQNNKFFHNLYQIQSMNTLLENLKNIVNLNDKPLDADNAIHLFEEMLNREGQLKFKELFDAYRAFDQLMNFLDRNSIKKIELENIKVYYNNLYNKHYIAHVEYFNERINTLCENYYNNIEQYMQASNKNLKLKLIDHIFRFNNDMEILRVHDMNDNRDYRMLQFLIYQKNKELIKYCGATREYLITLKSKIKGLMQITVDNLECIPYTLEETIIIQSAINNHVVTDLKKMEYFKCMIKYVQYQHEVDDVINKNNYKQGLLKQGLDLFYHLLKVTCNIDEQEFKVHAERPLLNNFKAMLQIIANKSNVYMWKLFESMLSLISLVVIPEIDKLSKDHKESILPRVIAIKILDEDISFAKKYYKDKHMYYELAVMYVNITQIEKGLSILMQDKSIEGVKKEVLLATINICRGYTKMMDSNNKVTPVVNDYYINAIKWDKLREFSENDNNQNNIVLQKLKMFLVGQKGYENFRLQYIDFINELRINGSE